MSKLLRIEDHATNFNRLSLRSFWWARLVIKSAMGSRSSRLATIVDAVEDLDESAFIGCLASEVPPLVLVVVPNIEGRTFKSWVEAAGVHEVALSID